LPNPDYVGTVVDTKRGVVELRVNREAGRATSVLFVARDFELQCDDGSTPSQSFNAREAEFSGRTSFDAFTARLGGYYRIHGQLVGQKRARGFLIYYEDPSDPPGSTMEAECSTVGGKQRWVAERVGE